MKAQEASFYKWQKKFSSHDKCMAHLAKLGWQNGLYIASKVNPWHDEGLQPKGVRKQFEEILQRLGRDSIDLLYLHSPDLDTPVVQTLKYCFELYQQGKFRDFGLSNYASWQVAEVVEICRREGSMEPTIQIY